MEALTQKKKKIKPGTSFLSRGKFFIMGYKDYACWCIEVKTNHLQNKTGLCPGRPQRLGQGTNDHTHEGFGKLG